MSKKKGLPPKLSILLTIAHLRHGDEIRSFIIEPDTGSVHVSLLNGDVETLNHEGTPIRYIPNENKGDFGGSCSQGPERSR